MVAFKNARESKVDHLERAAAYLTAHADNPAVAVCRYIKSILPLAENEFAVEMSGFLIGSVGSMLLRSFPDTELLKAKRLASMIVMSILPAGADLGMESVSSSEFRLPSSEQESSKFGTGNAELGTAKDLSDWFDTEGFATVLMSEHRRGQSPSSLILLPIEPDARGRYEGHIRDVDVEHDPRPGAWNYRFIKVQLAAGTDLGSRNP
jgi:hypothetical protein